MPAISSPTAYMQENKNCMIYTTFVNFMPLTLISEYCVLQAIKNIHKPMADNMEKIAEINIEKIE